MKKAFYQCLYALLLLGGTMGAAPGRLPMTPPKAAPELATSTQEPTTAKPHSSSTTQVGKASWYGGFFQGRTTASGEDYDMYDFTAAHRELPLGTYVKVTNLHNRRSVVVRINDRGPVTPGRIIDLSYSAAHALEMHERGIQKVRIDVVRPQAAEMAMARQIPAPH